MQFLTLSDIKNVDQKKIRIYKELQNKFYFDNPQN